MKHIYVLLSSITLAGAALAQTTQLAPPEQRMTDEVMHADYAGYRALQERIKRVNDKGRPIRDYHLSKAQCWLDVSFHEYTRNDRSPFPQQALTESEKLIVLMEQAPNMESLSGPWDTPLINDAAKLRPDLWERAGVLKKHAGFACAQQRVACAEVELVHAGNEFNQQQWRHAKPYVQIAEDQLSEAQQLADNCYPPPVVVAPVPAVPATPPPVSRTVQWSVDVVFNFDRYEAQQIRPESMTELHELIAKLKHLQLKSVQLTGHADRLNSTGQQSYNERLSERRVMTVRDYLVAQGIDAALVTTAARGDTQPVKACQTHSTRPRDLRECLLPNRRVEVRVSTVAQH